MERRSFVRLLEEDFKKLNKNKRAGVLSRIDKAYEEKRNVNGAIVEWLDEVDKLINMQVSREEITPEWCSKMRKKIKALDEKTKSFQPFDFQRDISDDQLRRLGVNSVYTPLGKYNPQAGTRGNGRLWFLSRPGGTNSTQMTDKYSSGVKFSPSPTKLTSTQDKSENDEEPSDTLEGSGVKSSPSPSKPGRSIEDESAETFVFPFQEDWEHSHSDSMEGSGVKSSPSPSKPGRSIEDESAETFVFPFQEDWEHSHSDSMEGSGVKSSPSPSKSRSIEDESAETFVFPFQEDWEHSHSDSMEGLGVKSPPSHVEPTPTIPSPSVNSTSSSRSKPLKSKKEVQDQKLMAQNHDIGSKIRSHSPDRYSSSSEFISQSPTQDGAFLNPVLSPSLQPSNSIKAPGAKPISSRAEPTISTTETETFLNPFLSPSVQPSNSIQTSGLKSTLSRPKPTPTISNPPAQSVSSGKSKEKAPYQELEARGVDTCHKTLSHSSATPPIESISSAKLVSFESTEEAQKGDTFQGLHPSSGDFMYLGSTYQAKNDLLEALQDDRYHSIGLYGKRGSGKTALVNAEMPVYENIFHPVVFVTVSEKADIAELQNQIAPQLNLKFQADKGKYKRALEIETTLKSKHKVLVIFDHVSTNFCPRDIEDIGIPDLSKQCKILLITQDKKCCNIKCHSWIPLPPLSDEDAWKLLQQYSGIDHESPCDLFNVAREVAFQCKGLPRVIEDVVSSLKNKNLEHWKETLDCLNHSMANHHIFISFRGRDTRDDFTASLFDAFAQGGFKVFKDDEQLRSGDQVSEALIKAIEQSRCSIVVLSENYAESSWCLDELVKILKCREEMKQLVLPIFYKVDPSHVRHLKGSFDEAITKKKERFEDDQVQEWTSALFKVSGLSGRDYKTGSQIAFIKEIVQYVRDNQHRLHIV